MNDTKFKVGDAVQLKHVESYNMIIDEIDKSANTVLCAWHAANGEPKSAKYSIDIIELVSNTDDIYDF